MRITLKLFLSAILSVMAISASAQTTDSSVAYQDENVRFTVITDGVIRLEWEPEGKFTDSPSFVASERDYPETDFKVRTVGKKLTIETAKMRLEYKIGSGKFTDRNLVIRSAKDFFPFTWKPGMKQQDNLKGTFRTLDGLDGDYQTQTWVQDMKQGETRQFEDGVIARDGWTLIDESDNFLFDESEWAWVKDRASKECQDW